ncbi:MAG: hypothetical protein O2875_03245 [Planctomycetota bacterium]|nr:hypothetical protein [Planctomycetota bacterium]MDA1261726.1 hypothetical protein [Planctomycetota bacterium]
MNNSPCRGFIIARRILFFTCIVAIGGSVACYEKVIRVKSNGTTTEVSDPDFNEKPGGLDELMWGPVPKGQDAATYYRKKKQLLAQ